MVMTATIKTNPRLATKGVRARDVVRTGLLDSVRTPASGYRYSKGRTTDGINNSKPIKNSTPQRVASGHQSSPDSHSDQTKVAIKSAAYTQSPAGLRKNSSTAVTKSATPAGR